MFIFLILNSMRIICNVYLYKYAFETCQSSITLYFLQNYFMIKYIEIYVTVNRNVYRIIQYTRRHIHIDIFAYFYSSTL